MTVTPFGSPKPSWGQQIQQQSAPLFDFWVEVSRGNVPGVSTFLARGHNTDLDTGVEEDVWETGGDLVYLTSAEKMNVASGSGDDAAAGTGLRTMLLVGVDNSGAEVSEVVVMDGASNVLSVNSYLRINLMVGLQVGSEGWNVGSVTATSQTAGTVQASIGATESISQNSHYTVPLGKSLLVVQAELNCANNTARNIEFKAYARSGGNGNAWVQLFDKVLDTGVTDEIDVLLPFGNLSRERSDIRFRAVSSGNNSEVRTRMYGLVMNI